MIYKSLTELVWFITVGVCLIPFKKNQKKTIFKTFQSSELTQSSRADLGPAGSVIMNMTVAYLSLCSVPTHRFYEFAVLY